MENNLSIQRANLLADVAEMYYLENMNQSQIAKQMGVDRSMISRMLAESRKNNVVEIRIHRPIPRDRRLESQLRTRLGLDQVVVVQCQSEEKEAILTALGKAAAVLFKDFIDNETIVGTTWGTAVNATISALEQSQAPSDIQVVQMVGALGSQRLAYNGSKMVQQMAQKLQGEAFFLNAPFFVESEEMADSLLHNSSVMQTMQMIRDCNIALVGVGSIDPQYSSFYQASYVELRQIEDLMAEGVVGDVCGIHFDINGQPSGQDFAKRCVTVSREQLIKIPVRFGVAGGVGKMAPIIGAAYGKLINVLVTDSNTAEDILRYLHQHSR